MSRYFYILFCALLALSITDPIAARKGFGGSVHSYPRSGGLSGGGHHSYPTSRGGLSGGGGYSSPRGVHSYPQNGRLSGNSNGYRSPGSNHGQSPIDRSRQTSTHNSANHNYPPGRLSGNTNSGHANNYNYRPTYNYNPPQQIRYTPTRGGPPVSYPVYHGTPPTYVYKYKDSGSKYGTLLTGLALLNLGTVAAGAYALSRSHSNYKPQPGEVCKFGLRKNNGDYEETRIDCKLITSFIFQEEQKTQNKPTNITTVTTTVTNVTTVNVTNPGASDAPVIKSSIGYEMLPNGTLVPINVTAANTTNASNNTSQGTMTSSVTVTTTNTTTLANAIDVKGKPVQVTSGMRCYVIRNTPTSNMKKSVPCGLLQTYAEKSLKKNSASRNIPAFTILFVLLAVYVV